MRTRLSASFTPVQQPFACSRCQARFTRQENLRRHELLHETDVKLHCEFCDVSCSRRDLLRRHIRRKHPAQLELVSQRSSISGQRHNSSTSTRTELDEQDDNLPRNNDLPRDNDLPPDDSDSVEPSSFGTTHSFAHSFDSRSNESRQLFMREPQANDPFFEHVASWLPFIHRATFDSETAPEHLFLAMTCLGHAAADDSLALDCYREAAMLVEDIEHVDDDALQLAQSLLMLETYAIVYGAEGLASAGLRHHHRLVALIRTTGLLRPPEQTAASDLEAVWRDFLYKESCKRTILAIHQMDAMWYHLLSIPRSLSHLEIKYEMPSDEWSANSASDWAYRRLTARSDKLITYPDAIRLCVTGAGEELSDAFGMTNITHFVLSSIREVSGWSTITDQVSMDRVEPLRLALVALESHKHKSLSFEATWRITMVEFHIWSLSHTGGVVHSSVESALLYSTRLAAAGNLIFSMEIMESIRPHVEWFLRYLDTSVQLEPPWVLLFAYQVFLWTWQCLKQGLPSVFAMLVDGTSALAWARTAFSRRQDKTAKAILRCLDILSDAGD